MILLKVINNIYTYIDVEKQSIQLNLRAIISLFPIMAFNSGDSGFDRFIFFYIHSVILRFFFLLYMQRACMGLPEMVSGCGRDSKRRRRRQPTACSMQ